MMLRAFVGLILAPCVALQLRGLGELELDTYLANGTSAEGQARWSRAAPLIHQLIASQSTVKFVDVGACDGAFDQSNNPVQSVLREKKVQAVLVEPNPVVYKMLEKNVVKHFGDTKRIRPVRVAISAESGHVKFYVVSERFAKEHPNAPHFMKYQLSSMSRQQVVKHYVAMGKGWTAERFDKYVDEIKVPSKTPPDFLSMVDWPAPSVDLLKVDAEGWDAIIVNGFLNTAGFAAKIIIFESGHLSDEDLINLLSNLSNKGYTTDCVPYGCRFNVAAWLPQHFQG